MLGKASGGTICGAAAVVLKMSAMGERVNTKPEDFASLYRRAFEEFGSSALWSSRCLPDPTPADALAIARSLRVEGNLKARQLAEQIEQACHATL